MLAQEVNITAAQAYEDHLVSTVFGPWAEKVVALAEPKSGETVLDIACGTGIGARLAAPRMAGGGKIVSADSDASMVIVAELAAEAAGLPDDVVREWLTVPAERLDVPANSVDLCLFLQGPQFVSDPPAVMELVHAALRQDGRLAASMWNELPNNKGHYAIAQALEKRGIAPAMKPFSKGDPQAARDLIAGAGLEIDIFETSEYFASFSSVRAFVNGVAAGAPATRHAIAQLSESDREAFLADVEDTLAPYVGAGGVELPTSAHIVVAYRRDYLE